MKFRLSTLCVLLTSISLVACGGSDRNEPFNPGTGNSSNSSQVSTGAKIPLTRLYEGTDPLLPFGEYKQVITLRDMDEFRKYWDAYSNETYDGSIVNFETGQVVLIDEGGNTPCNESLKLSSYSAYDFSNNTVLLKLNYTDLDKPSSSSQSSSSVSSSSSDSSSSTSSYAIECTNKTPIITYKRNFRFYFIPSRKTLMIEENVSY